MPDELSKLESFVKALDAFKASLDKHAEAIREHEQAHHGDAEPHAEQVIRSVVRLPPAIEGYYNSEQRDRPRKNRWERIKRTLEAGGLFVAVTLAALTYG